MGSNSIFGTLPFKENSLAMVLTDAHGLSLSILKTADRHVNTRQTALKT